MVISTEAKNQMRATLAKIFKPGIGKAPFSKRKVPEQKPAPLSQKVE